MRPGLEQLAFALRRELDGEVRFDPGSRHLYATDASNYRHVPAGVVLPRHVDDIVATLARCREAGVPVVTRGAGTSLAGQATGAGVVLDCSRHLDGILEVDPDAATARVEPGVVLDRLQAAAAPHGLMFGPDPSTHDRCTLGGMIGNDACGVHSLTTGRTMHNVEALEVLLADGTRLEVGRHHLDDAARLARAGGRVGEVFGGLLALRERIAPLVGRFPAIPRRVSGFHLEQLLDDDHLHVARALVGTEGTCAVVVGATVRLVPRPPHRAVVVIAHADLPAAADHTPALLVHDLLGLEGLDEHLAAGASRPGRPPSRGVELLPAGRAWLLAEVGGDTAGEARAAADTLAAAVERDLGGATAVRVVDDPADQRALWRVRADGLGAITFVPGQRPKLGGWEDAAVAPEHLGAYLRGLGTLLTEHGLSAGVYGHFGDGCVHTKIDFDHTTAAGRATFRRFVEEAADLVVSHGGSLSGEHGDGQARGELLERMYGPELVAAFRDFKALWDPDGLLNPGRVVDARPLDADLRLADRDRMVAPDGWFALPDGDLAGAAARCVGVGLCRRDEGTGTMCPSWMATHEEQHSTRGRAHLLFELLQPDTQLDGWRDDAVADALDLCLSCKACKAECPVDVDLATYKAEFLAHRYEGRLRPAQHYALGLSHRWLRLGSRLPRAVNAVLGSPVGRLLRRAGDLAAERPLPELAPEPFSRWWRGRPSSAGAAPAGRVLLFVDTFTETLEPEVGRAAVTVLEAAGHRVEVAERPVCCGRPLYDHGMLDTARRQLTRLARTLGPAAHAGVPIVGLEPSCVAALRDELPGLLPEDADARAVAGAAATLAEHLTAIGWRPPRLETEVVLHAHCHHQAVLGTEADRRLLAAAAGTTVEELDAGCCGLAGSFGLRAGEPYEVSVAAGEDRFAPRVRAAAARGATVVSDGTSCRTQAAHLAPEATGVHHLAVVLADALRNG